MCCRQMLINTVKSALRNGEVLQGVTGVPCTLILQHKGFSPEHLRQESTLKHTALCQDVVCLSQPLMSVMVCNSCCGVMCLWGLEVDFLTVIALRFKDTDAVNYPQLCSQAANIRNAAYENAIFAHAMICSLFIPRPVCLVISKMQHMPIQGKMQALINPMAGTVNKCA